MVLHIHTLLLRSGVCNLERTRNRESWRIQLVFICIQTSGLS